MELWRKQLQQLSAANLLRTLRTVDGAQDTRITLGDREVLLLCSNNYLGLANHPLLVEAGCRALQDYGAGSGGSRLISGSMRLHADLEDRLAAFKHTEAALLFNSGYAANTGILQALLGPDDVIFSDQLNHASIIDGCRLSRARTLVFPHGDVEALERMMVAEQVRRKGLWLMVTDGVFSMDGDLAPLPELVRLKERFDCLLMVDDAHGTGVLGETGRGTAEYLDCLPQIDIHMGTLGKALGGFGAFVAGSRPLVDLLINRARSFIFSTSLPPAVAATALVALELVAGAEGRALRESLHANRVRFLQSLKSAGLQVMEQSTPIIPILTGEPAATMAASARLLEEGFFVQGIRPPTVPEGCCRLRATVMATHRAEELKLAAFRIAAAVRSDVC